MSNILKLFKDNQEQESLKLDANGIVGDKHHGKDINRSVLISSTYSYELAKKNDIDLKYGELGENILVNFNPYTLDLGERVRIGSVILEISQKCPICKTLSCINKKLPLLLKKDRGIFAKVIKEGTITNNSEIILL
ncbi:MAG TPA: MOSC domain-containing protein [Sulfurospirillum arcachonense]|nr:MOSC domain-containing protein [Sulfurospirillum arcachonense]